jgi:hypothetical protein
VLSVVQMPEIAPPLATIRLYVIDLPPPYDFTNHVLDPAK